MTRIASWFVYLTLASLLVLTSPAAAQHTASAPRVTAVSAQLYYEETGTFSRNILAPPGFALWNAIIGGGDAEHASSATLVRVEVSGRNVPLGAVRVVVTATGARGRILGRRESRVDLYDDRTKFYAPLFLNDTGCDEITISARLLGRGVSSAPTVQTIPFRCGE